MDRFITPEEIYNDSFKFDISTICGRLIGQVEYDYFKAESGFVGCLLKIVDEADINQVRREVFDYFTSGIYYTTAIESFAFCGRLIIVIPYVQ